MVLSRVRRPAVAALVSLGLVLTSLTLVRSTGAEAASRVALAAAPKPVILVVDTRIMATSLATSTALQRGGAALGLPLNVLAPSSIPTDTQLYSLNIQRPLTGYSAGEATLGFVNISTGKYVFQIDESPVPIFFGRAKQTATTINGHAGIIYDLGASGSNHLIAITWSLGSFRFYDITSNVGKSKLTTAALLKIAASVPSQIISPLSVPAATRP